MENLNSFTKIRIIYSDPDATDSSSEDDDKVLNGFISNGSKKFITEILVPNMPPQSCADKFLLQDFRGEMFIINSNLYASSGNRKSCSFSSFNKGVRRSKWMKYEAETQDPFRGVQMELGTFDSEEEAANKIYTQKKIELDILVALKRRDALHLEDPNEGLVFSSHSHFLDVTDDRASVDNGINISAKENFNNVKTNGEAGNLMNPVYEDESILHMLEEPFEPYLAGENLNLEEQQNGAKSFGNYFDHFSYNDIDGCSKWDTENEGSSNQPLVNICPLDDMDLAWFDEN